uniref:Uncharacterized protein n=1 Tax=Anguilla anguilla TaxID=7936 RepID=A0A0E9RGM4_ANGAN
MRVRTGLLMFKMEIHIGPVKFLYDIDAISTEISQVHGYFKRTA